MRRDPQLELTDLRMKRVVKEEGRMNTGFFSQPRQKIFGLRIFRRADKRYYAFSGW